MSDEKITVSIDSDLEDLIPGFLENRAKDLVSLRKALDDGDYRTLQSIGHSLKGVGGGYGFHGITDLGAGIETAAREEDGGTLAGLLDQYSDYLQRVHIVYE